MLRLHPKRTGAGGALKQLLANSHKDCRILLARDARNYQGVTIRTDRTVVHITVRVGERQGAIGRHRIGPGTGVVGRNGPAGILGISNAVAAIAVGEHRDRLAESRGDRRSAVLRYVVDALKGSRCNSSSPRPRDIDVRIVA